MVVLSVTVLRQSATVLCMDTPKEHVASGDETANEPPVQLRTSRHLIETRHRPFRHFLGGASVIFDFFGTNTWSRVSTVKHRTDLEALAGDWRAVGDDLRRAMVHYPLPSESTRRHRDRR